MLTPGQLELLTLAVETSTCYVSRGSMAGIIQPTQGLIGRVYALLGLGRFCSVFSYLFFTGREPIVWLPFIPLFHLYNDLVTWTIKISAHKLEDSKVIDYQGLLLTT